MSKVLLVKSDSVLSSSGYTIIEHDRNLKKVKRVASLIDKKYSPFSKCALTRRLFRAEITGLYELADGSMIAIAKKGLFKRSVQGGDFHKVFAMPRGSKPLNLCILKNSHIFFGEYFQNVEKGEVHVYGSKDNGASWQVVYSFPAGNINHVHGLFLDPYIEHMWVLTGDRENECIIGYTDDEFQTLHEVFRGGQEYRSCHLFFYEDFIVYATDSQYIQNEIRIIDRKTLKIATVVQIQGSAIKGGQSGNISYLSTTIEPSEVNTPKASHLWYTKDGKHWVDVISYKKDCLPALLQFGSIEFPQHKAPITDRIYFSGRALKGLDGESTYIEI